MDYDTLTQRIQDWTENDATEFTNIIDTIIGLGELRIQREADLTIFRKEDTATLSIGNTTVQSLPTDIVRVRWIKAQSGEHLLSKDESYINEYNKNATAGAPVYWAYKTDGDEIIVGPSPDVAYTLDIGYTYRIDGLSSTNSNNWLGDNAEDVLLYACLLEAQGFMKEEQQEFDRWTGMYERALQTLVNEEQKRRRSDEYRTGEMR